MVTRDKITKSPKTKDLREISKKRLATLMLRTVEYITFHDKSCASHLEKIGTRILRRFFGNDPRRVHSKNSIKGFSLRRLSQMEGIGMSYGTLQRCVALAIQRADLPKGSLINQLGTTHRVMLLRVEEKKQKRADIKMILEKKLSVAEYKAILDERYGTKNPELPTATEDSPEDPGNADQTPSDPFESAEYHVTLLTADKVHSLKPRQRKKAIEDIKDMLQHLTFLLDELGHA